MACPLRRSRANIAALLITLVATTSAHATILFTTASDFAGWSTGTSSAVPTTSYDADNISFNGVANPSPGTLSTPGSLQVNPPVAGTLGDAAFSSNLADNLPFMSAIDPGFTPGTTAAYTGTLLITYTIPTTASDFIFGLNLAYDADAFYDNLGPTLTSDPILIDGLTTRTALFNYSIQPGPLNTFYFRVAYNSSSPITSPFYLDAIQVPEPATLSLLLPIALLRRRR
ncbi:MAG TPA: hypothetical protein VFE58_02620 [Tepidisphaeraceae bacterium]|jgi:hypothetical protein|nr:hypothetical protein [Tepidisphaeraceae bacterium]